MSDIVYIGFETMALRISQRMRCPMLDTCVIRHGVTSRNICLCQSLVSSPVRRGHSHISLWVPTIKCVNIRPFKEIENGALL